MGKIFKPDENLIKSSYLQENKNKILKNFGLIDDRKFWDKNYEDENIDQLFEKYKIVKTYLREQIILHVSKNFKKQFCIYGEDKKYRNKLF